MSGRTKIEWSDAVWNPIRGCSKVSEGCRNCYAVRQAHRFSGVGMPYEGLTRMMSHGPEWTGQVRIVPEVLDQPLRWKKPRRIFVNSMSDLFHENVTDEWLDRIFAVMALAKQHTFLVLTKRPERMRRWFTTTASGAKREILVWETAGRPERWPGWPLPNVWIGVSVENQQAADERIPLLLETPAAVRFVSAEPLLGPLDLTAYLPRQLYVCQSCGVELGQGEVGLDFRCPYCGAACDPDGSTEGLDWVIVGGESGPGARPMHPDWVWSLRDQCQQAGVAFFFKQWGEFAPVGWVHADSDGVLVRPDGHVCCDRSELAPARNYEMRRVGKKAAGRLLDGRTWDEMPEVGTQ